MCSIMVKRTAHTPMRARSLSLSLSFLSMVQENPPHQPTCVRAHALSFALPLFSPHLQCLGEGVERIPCRRVARVVPHVRH